MPKFHASFTVTVDVVMTIEAPEHSKVHHIIKDKLTMAASLADFDSSKFNVVEENITEIDDLTVTK